VEEPGPETAVAQTATARLPAIREAMPRSPSCTALASGPVPPRKQLLTESAQQLQRARRELVRGDLDAAESAYCRSTQWDKGNVDALTGLARLLLLRRDARGAALYARRALKIRPRDLQIQALLGDALARMGDLKSARASWYAAGNVQAHDRQAVASAVRHNMSIAEHALEQRDSARGERFFRRAALLDPDNAEAAAGLAHALVLIGDLRSASAWAKRATLLAPKSAPVRVLSGDVLAQAGDKAHAEAEWRAALDLDPNNVDAQIRIRRIERTH
jgi:tetratricopeptide (TPR) repeat protein